MNFTIDEIMKELESGKKAEDIVASFTSTLNDAVKQKKKNDEAALEASRREKYKKENLERILADFDEWAKEFYPNVKSTCRCIGSCEDILKMMDTTDKLVKKVDSASSPKDKFDAFDEVMRDFFKEFKI